MNWTSLLVNSDEGDTAKAQPKPVDAPVTKFPTENKGTTFPSGNSFPTGNSFQPANNGAPVDYVGINPYLDKILEVYDQAFNKLNQPGYDFFEFFRAVTKSGIDNPMVYEMALEMGQSMDGNVSKQLLLSQADFYITELNKIYNGNNADGQAKNADLVNKKNTEANSLVSDLSNLKMQLQQIQSQITDKEKSLADIDQKYQPQIQEVSLKLSANDTAKDRFLTTINKVKTNILTNLK